MASTAGIYWRIAGSRVRARLEYRTSFALSVVGAFIFSSLDFVMILVIFGNLPDHGDLGGWEFPELAFLYGTSYVTFRIADVLMTNLDSLPLQIRMGTFDQILTRPLGTLGQVLTGQIDIRHIGGMLQGLIVLVIALSRLSIDWTAGRIAVFCSMLVGAVVIFCAIWIITNSIAFWTMDAREVANSFTYGGNMLTQFPINIFGTWFRRVFGYLVPLAFVNYVPALYILGKSDPEVPSLARFMSPLVALASAAVAALVWRAAVRRYRSTGS